MRTLRILMFEVNSGLTACSYYRLTLARVVCSTEVTIATIMHMIWEGYENRIQSTAIYQHIAVIFYTLYL